MNLKASICRVETVIVAYAAWMSHDILWAWRNSPFDHAGAFAFLLWLVPPVRAAWGRPADRLGSAVVVNGLSAEHRDYLAAGGYGFLLGDGRLDYAREEIWESCYSVAMGRHLALSADFQRVLHPGYNQDRGPVSLYALRIHAQF